VAAELLGLARASTVTAGENGSLSLELRTNHATVARKAYKLFQAALGVGTRVFARRRRQLDKATLYHVRAEGPALLDSLVAAGITGRNGEPLSLPPLSECCRRAFLRAIFLAAGSMGDPRRGYHWEVSLADRVTARKVRDLLRSGGIRSGLVRRRHEHVVYLKDAEGIASWLTMAGAHEALLSLENTRIYKDMRNRLNRLVNCETANLSRTIDAGMQQQLDIRLLIATRGLETLPPSLREVARLRLEHSDATLEELGRLVDPPLGKSGVNHRLREIRRLASELRRERRGEDGGTDRDAQNSP
jgi:DNA-binding protein WhiA